MGHHRRQPGRRARDDGPRRRARHRLLPTSAEQPKAGKDKRDDGHHDGGQVWIEHAQREEAQAYADRHAGRQQPGGRFG